MRVGIDYTAAVSQGAGIGRYTRGLFRALIALDPKDEFVLYYSHPLRQPPPRLFPGVKNVVERPFGVPERWLSIMWFRARIPIPIDVVTGPVDIFHFPNFVLPPVRHGSTVVTIHDLTFLVHPE